MNHSKNINIVTLLFVAMFSALIIYFIYAINIFGGRWFTNPYNTRLQKEKASVQTGDITDRNGTVLATTDSEGERIYNKDKALRKSVSHVVGDSAGLTSTGAESVQAKYLLGFDANVFERIYQQISGENRKGSDVRLTIDAKLSEYIAEQMGSNKGAVVLMNYQTGEVIAMVSNPGFDPSRIEEYRQTEGEEIQHDTTSLVNRATMGIYPPGSVFKIITAAAAVRHMENIDERVWDSSGPLAFSKTNGRFQPEVKISAEQDKILKQQEQENAAKSKQTPEPSATPNPDPDAQDEMISEDDVYTEETDQYHLLRNYNLNYYGEVSLKTAFAKSCNVTFAHIGMELGAKKIETMAKAFGIGENFMFNDLIIYASSFSKASDDYYLAWSAVGQYKDLVTPINMAMISASIANNGVMMEPKIVKGIINSRNFNTQAFKSKVYSKPITEAEAAKLKEYMRYCVTNGTGSSAGIKKYEVCGKTGTAEVSSDKNVQSHAWFTGFVDSEDHPLAIAVILEKAGTGGGKAAPVASKVFSQAIKLGY